MPVDWEARKRDRDFARARREVAESRGEPDDFDLLDATAAYHREYGVVRRMDKRR